MTTDTLSTGRHRVSHAVGCASRASSGRRRLAVAALGLGGVAMVGSGAFAAWQTSTSLTTGTVTAATTAITLQDANGSTFTSGVPNLLPGDYFHRYVDVRNTGTQDSSLTGAIAITGTLGGHVLAKADRCSVAWTTVSGVSTCTGTLTALTAEQTVPGSGLAVPLGTVSPGAINDAHVRYRFKLADSAPANLMGATSTIEVSASGSATGGRDRTSS